MSIVDRAKNIILKPAEEWNVIAAEPETVSNLFTSYAVILALIPAIIGLLASLLIGALLSQYMGGIMPALTTTALVSQTIAGYFMGCFLFLRWDTSSMRCRPALTGGKTSSSR